MRTFRTSNSRLLAITARTALVAALIVAAWQLTVLVNRAARGASDFGFYYRAAARIEAVGGEVYASLDPRTLWPCCLPPSGMVFFSLFQHLSPAVAGVVWALVNLSLLGVCLAGLAVTVRRLEHRRESFLNSFEFAAAVLLVVASGSLQTGQLSVLIVACWLLFLGASARGRLILAGSALALPAALKFYPALLVMVPLLMRARRQVVAFAVATPLLLIIPPALYYGHSDATELWSSYWHNSLLGEGDINIVRWRLKPEVLRNQSLDMGMLRYLTKQDEFSLVAPQVPHLDFSERSVLVAANLVRAVVVLITVLVAWFWLRRVRPSPVYAALMLMALWAAAMYLILPEAKDRYAVYTFPAFLPLLAAGYEALVGGRRRRAIVISGLVVVCLVLVMGVPTVLQQLSVGLLGPILLWTTNCSMLCTEARSVPDAPPPTSPAGPLG